MRLLAGKNLAEQVLSHRLGEERIARTSDDRDEPWQDQQREPGDSDQRFECQQPSGRAIADDQRAGGQPDNHDDERPLEQHADGERAPEYPRQQPCGGRFESLALVRQICPRHRPHRSDDGEEQHGIRLGDEPFDAKEHATCHHETGEQRGAARDKGERRPIRQKDRADSAEQRRHPVEPDGCESSLEAKRARDLYHGSL
jgi:hypothetical protein